MLNREDPEGYYRLSKRVARDYFKCGVDIYMIPHKARFDMDSTFLKPFHFSIEICLDSGVTDFDTLVNSYQHYNCNSELGYYPSFYIKREDL